MQTEKQKPIAMSLLCVVCSRENKEKVKAVLEAEKAFFNLAMLGKGTANGRILGYLGLGETEKLVYFTILPAHLARALMETMDAAMASTRSPWITTRSGRCARLGSA